MGMCWDKLGWRMGSIRVGWDAGLDSGWIWAAGGCGRNGLRRSPGLSSRSCRVWPSSPPWRPHRRVLPPPHGESSPGFGVLGARRTRAGRKHSAEMNEGERGGKPPISGKCRFFSCFSL